MIDSDLSYHQHISKVIQTSYLHIRQIRKIRHSLDLISAVLLGNSLVSSRLDFCNSLFYGLPKSSLKRLQCVQNTLARVVISSCKKYDHIQPVLHQLHWLPVDKRIEFKIATLTYKVLETSQPSYLSASLCSGQISSFWGEKWSEPSGHTEFKISQWKTFVLFCRPHYLEFSSRKH